VLSRMLCMKDAPARVHCTSSLLTDVHMKGIELWRILCKSAVK